jgi:hypothetical protein
MVARGGSSRRRSESPSEQEQPDPPAKEGDGCPFIPRVTVVRRERVAMKTTRERAEEKRQEKLELVQQQLESGSLVIRQMTEEERRRYPPRPGQPRRHGRR